MKLVIIIAYLLLTYSLGFTQQTCVTLTPTSQRCTVRATWQGTTDNPDRYILRRQDAGGSFADVQTVTAPITTVQDVFNDAGNVPHCYVVLAGKGTQVSGPSNTSCWTSPPIPIPPPNAPTGLTLSALSRNDIQLSWQNNCPECTSQEIAMTRAQPTKNWTIPIPGNVSNYIVGNLQRNKTYTGKVRAVSNGGVSAYSNSSSATTLR